MSKRIFTKEQIEELSKNKNIKKLSEKSITYSKDFKTKAVKQYYDEYLTPNEIFKQAGFNTKIIGKKAPKECLRRWKKTFQDKGIKGLKETRGKTGRPRKIRDKTDKDKIERLEAENIYLKAENDFLVKLRAKRNY